jgi:hypothetical protein
MKEIRMEIKNVDNGENKEELRPGWSPVVTVVESGR